MGAANLRPKVVVTGGAGYIGSHVCKALAAAGHLPVTYDDLSEGHRWAVRWGPIEIGDVEDTARLEAVLRAHRPSAIIHLAGLIAAGTSVVEPARYYASNVNGMLSVLRAALTCGIDRLVFSSSAAVYGKPQWTPLTEEHPLHPINPYGAT